MRKECQTYEREKELALIEKAIASGKLTHYPIMRLSVEGPANFAKGRYNARKVAARKTRNTPKNTLEDSFYGPT